LDEVPDWGYLADLALINAGELVTCGAPGQTDEERLGVIEDGALLVEEGKVSWVGRMKELKRKTVTKSLRTIDARGSLVTPGFVDPHTHLVFAGSREDELERKASGESYTSILAGGGGIQRTIRETRRASARKIARESKERLMQLLANGVTTAEVKTGYGQRLPDELKMLEAIRILRKAAKVELIPTFLGLHAAPPEFEDSGDYAAYAIRNMLPFVAGARDRPVFSDCFCEEGVFSRDDCSNYLRASRELGLSLKIHADEFADSGGAALSAELGCVSADHLGKSDPAGVEEMARKGVVAVLLPGTSLYSSIPYADARGILNSGCRVALGTDLSPNSWIESPQMVMSLACTGLRMTPAEMARKGVVAVLLPGTSLYSSIPYADARGILNSGCRVALGTDLSPNSWIESPQMVMSLACTGLRMTPAQALLGCTINAAKAVSRDDLGSLSVGYSADFVVHSVPSYRFLPYRVGGRYVRRVYKRGREVYSTGAD